MKVTMVGLGTGDGGLTLRGLRELKLAESVVVRTDMTRASAILREEGIPYRSLDEFYEQCEDYDALCECIAREVLSQPYENVVYAVPGSAAMGDATVMRVASACRERGIGFEIVPGVGWEGIAAASAGGVDRAMVTAAADYGMLAPDPRQWLLVTELDRREVASELKLRLLDSYPAEHEVLLCGAAVPLCDIDRGKEYGHDSVLCVPPADLTHLERFDFHHLMEIMTILRDPVNGCPWDGEQTHQSLKPYLIEEAYEVIEAIDSGDEMRIADELGDVLLQVAYHACIAREHAEFSIGDVTTAICEKMISRHTHIFGDDVAHTSADVLVTWEANKKKEKGLTTQADVLRDVPRSLPALMRAQKLLKKAADGGLIFAKQDCADRLAHMARDVSRGIEDTRDSERIAGEMLLYAVELARSADISVENALYGICEKFVEIYVLAEAEAENEGDHHGKIVPERFMELWKS